jgi:hypothetical protein
MKIDQLPEIERTGWEMDCPFCEDSISYTTFTNQSGPTPFFYSDGHNDILLRQSDLTRVIRESTDQGIDIDALEVVWRDILSNAPDPPRGGEFTLWANVKCPLCSAEFPYNNGLRDRAQRICEPKIIVPDGAIIMTDGGCNRIRVKTAV